VHGAVAGGGLAFVYAADLAIAAEDAKFVTAFATLGLSGDGGGTWHLPRLIGARRAAEAYLRNRPVQAAEALEWGLVNELVPAEQLRDRATAVARDLATGPTRGFSRIRALLRDAWRNDLSMQLQAETEALRYTGDTADAAKAISLFAEKRRPEFTGG
jgi:2-(1,2-epoxy-1,2-dihydrophenyl)acetyl-CoA isomerase